MSQPPRQTPERRFTCRTTFPKGGSPGGTGKKVRNEVKDFRLHFATDAARPGSRREKGGRTPNDARTAISSSGHFSRRRMGFTTHVRDSRILPREGGA